MAPSNEAARWPVVGHLRRMLKVGAIGFGGGSALIPVLERELVGPGRLSEDDFTQDTVIANITPGALPVKVAATSGVRVGGVSAAVGGALAVALPGALATVALLAVFAALGPGAIRVIEYASLGITAFILYLLGHYVHKVLAPSGRVRPVAIIVAVVAYLLTGAGQTLELIAAAAGIDEPWTLPELSALQLVIVALLGVGVGSIIQHARDRRHPATTRAAGEVGASFTRAAGAAAGVFAVLAGLGCIAATAAPAAGDAFRLLGLVLTSTLTSFGGGEAYVGVADGFFVAGGLVDPAVFYGQIVPIANALPGPILVKIAAGVAFVAGGDAGWLMAAGALFVAVGACSALAVAVLSVYSRARESVFVRNLSAFIMPVICGLLASTAVSMLHSNVRIAASAGIPDIVTIVVSVALAASVVGVHRIVRVPDIVLILVMGAATLGVLVLM